MAKSKLVKVNEKIAERVVGGYKKIESGAVSGFTRMSDSFVDQFLTKDGESVEDAKKRLAEEQKEREEMREEEEEDHEEKYIYSNDSGNCRRNPFCTWHVHGADTGVECIPSGSDHGSGRSSRASHHGTCMEEDGKQRPHPCIRENHRDRAV